VCRIVAAILKMATGRNFLMSGINSGHHNLPTYEMALKSDNVEFVQYCGGHFENGMSAIFKIAAKTRHKKWAVKIQHCLISSKFYMWVDNDVLNLLNLCGIVVAILKMATGRNFLMSGINSGHHNLPTYEMLLKSDNVEFVWYCSGHFVAKIKHCPISSKFDLWVHIDSRH
jgi:5-carboxymethyl-2-hydroxymuconate isomerase